MTMKQPISPDEIAAAATSIYDEMYREEYEMKFDGHFVVIDIMTKESYRHKWPEGAIEKSQKKAPDGVFYLIRIGSPAAFRAGPLMESTYARAL